MSDLDNFITFAEGLDGVYKVHTYPAPGYKAVIIFNPHTGDKLRAEFLNDKFEGFEFNISTLINFRKVPDDTTKN